MAILRQQLTSEPVQLPDHLDFTRADLEIYGINHFRPSYTTHVYLNAPQMDDLAATHESYAGSFSIFGHQRCSGSDGHCEVHEHLRRFDDRPSHPLTRAFKRVVITEPLRRAMQAGNQRLAITFVATAIDDDIPDGGPLLDYQGLQITLFD
jgi:hypothetical protein